MSYRNRREDGREHGRGFWGKISRPPILLRARPCRAAACPSPRVAPALGSAARFIVWFASSGISRIRVAGDVGAIASGGASVLNRRAVEMLGASPRNIRVASPSRSTTSSSSTRASLPPQLVASSMDVALARPSILRRRGPPGFRRIRRPAAALRAIQAPHRRRRPDRACFHLRGVRPARVDDDHLARGAGAVPSRAVGPVAIRDSLKPPTMRSGRSRPRVVRALLLVSG